MSNPKNHRILNDLTAFPASFTERWLPRLLVFSVILGVAVIFLSGLSLPDNFAANEPK
jgi:uncharacterized RDD family membrane protein YckC